MAMSLVASTGGVTLLPLYAEKLLPPSVITGPLQGAVPTFDLVGVGLQRVQYFTVAQAFSFQN
jgi:hypothetical protein